MQNGVDTRLFMFMMIMTVLPGVEFNDDLTISTAGSNATYLYGIDVEPAARSM